jgi:ATP-dependent DNA ligase
MASKRKQKRTSVPRARKTPRSAPAFVEPMAAQVVKKLPEGDDWLYEVKFDEWWPGTATMNAW